MLPSQSPTADVYDANATSFSSFSNSSVLICTNNTLPLHGQCSACLSKHYALFNLLAFVMMLIMLIISFHTVSPPHIFNYIQHLQSIGMLCLIQNVKLPLLVMNTLQQVYYWSGFDWTAIVTPDCLWGTSTSRFIVTCLPISLASLLQVVRNAFLKRCDTFPTYYSLGLLLFLPSVLVTVGEAVLCEGDYFCASAGSWWPRLVPPLSIFFCATHFISLILSIVQERHLTDSILHRIFRYWWWSYETILRRLIQVSFIFFYEGRQCLLLFTGLDLCSTIWHFIFSPWAKPLPSCSVNTLLCFCQISLSAIAFIGEKSSDLSIVLGIFVLLLTFGSIIAGLLFMDSSDVANDSNSTALDDEEEQAPTKRISDVDGDDQSVTPTFDAELPTAPADKQQLEMAEPVDDPSQLEQEVVANAFHVSAPPISVLYDQAFSHSDQTLLASNHN